MNQRANRAAARPLDETNDESLLTEKSIPRTDFTLLTRTLENWISPIFS
jgi:hypothetical protein